MTRLLRTLIAPALALVAITSTAKADYTFTPVSNSVTGTNTIVITPVASVTSPDGVPSNPVLFNIALNGTPVGTYGFTFTETITGTGGLPTVTFTEVGTFQVFFSGPTAIVSTYTATSVTGNGTYTIPPAAANYITSVSGTTATLAIGVIPPQAAAVPEPASLAMLGMGLLVPAGFAARRRFARA